MTTTLDRVRAWTLGLDLGFASDFSALVGLERIDTLMDDQITKKRYEIRLLRRIRLGTPYEEIVEIVGHVMKALPRVHGQPPPQLIVDGTGAGLPVCQLLKKAGLGPISVTITGGREETTSGNFNFNIPKRNLVASLQVAFQSGRLKISRDLPDAENLINELLNFRVTISSSGHDSYDAWRERIHDDLVLATALALWWNERPSGQTRFVNIPRPEGALGMFLR